MSNESVSSRTTYRKFGENGLKPVKGVVKPYSAFIETEHFVETYEDVYVLSPFGFILDKNFEPIWEAMNEIIYWCGRPNEYPALQRLIGNEALRVENTYLQRTALRLEHYANLAETNCEEIELDNNYTYIYASHPFQEMVYGHLFDTLQRLFYIKDLPKEKCKLIISSDEKIQDFSRHLELLNFNLPVVRRSKTLSLLKVPRLIVPSSPIYPAGSVSEIYDWFYDCYVTRNKKQRSLRRDGLNLYLDRSHIPRQNKRSFTNEAVINDYLYRSGFVNHINFRSLDETIAAFNSAERIVGAHGAAFQNIMFANENAEIYEFMPHNRIVDAFGVLPKKTSKYTMVVTEADEISNIKLSLDELTSTINSE